MKTVLISGLFYNVDFKSLTIILSKSINKQLSSSSLIEGEEINYEDDLHEIYIHRDDMKINSEDYIFDSEYKGNLQDANTFLKKLIDELLVANIKYKFEYNEAVDDEAVGEEYVLEHPQLRANT